MRGFILLLLLVFTNYGCGVDIDTFYKYLKSNSSTSSDECEKQKVAFLEALENRNSWALKSK